MICGVAVYIFLPQNLQLITRELVGWNAGIWLYFALVAVMIAKASKEFDATASGAPG